MKLLQFEILSIGHRYSLVVVRGEDYFPCDKRVLKGRGKWGGGECTGNSMYRLVSLVETNIPGTELYSLTV